MTPQAILLTDVEQLGERGDVIDVSAGYLRNFLVPRGLAQTATKGAIEAARRRMEAETRAKLDAETRSQEYAVLLSKTVLTIPKKTGDDGRLYGSVTAQDIVDAVRDARGIRLDKRKVHLAEPIKQIGTAMVEVEVADGVRATIKTMVVES